MFKSVAELIDDTLVELGLVSGTAVQTYTEPQIRKGIFTAFDTLYLKRFWPHLTRTTVHDLDGIVGVVTDSNINILSFLDIQWIRFEPFYQNDVIHALNGEPYYNRNDFCYDTLSWDNPQYSTKLIQFYPKDLALKVAIRARRRPTFTSDDDQIIPLDAIMLKHLVTSNILAGDGTNPSAEQRQTTLFDQRYTDLISNEANDVTPLTRQRANSFRIAE